MPKQENLQKIISLTFDEDPEIRKKAAKKLSDLEDPGALFALLELTYDKDQSVKDFARKLLDKKEKGSKSEEFMSFSELFSYKEKKQGESFSEEIITDKKKKLLHPIEQIFEKRLGKDKSSIVKSKMMPSLEKVYLKATSSGKNQEKSFSDDERKEAIQEFLTTYLDAISDHPSKSASLETTTIEKIDCADSIDSLESLDLVSARSEMDGESVDLIIREAEDSTPAYSEEEEHNKFLKNVPDSLFKKAYEMMMYSGGDKKLMKQEMKRMIKNAEKDIKLAFTLAKEKFKENKITKLTEIKEKMRNIVTDNLTIVSRETVEFKKPRSSTFAIRLLVQDPEGTEGVIYLFDGRGEALASGMKIKISKGYAKIINGETAITLGSKGNIYIVI